MTRFSYFKITFQAISIGLTTAMVTKGLLLDISFTDWNALGFLLRKSFLVGCIVGLFMGLLSMYFKIGPLKKLNHSQATHGNDQIVKKNF